MYKKINFIGVLFAATLLFCSHTLMAQEMKTFTWDTYKTKFSVPSDFRVTKSTENYWSGTNDDITMSIYPRTGENLTFDEMEDAVYKWTVDNEVENIGESVELDSDKLNGYWGVMYEGSLKGFPVATMLMVDPDYTEISLYVWVSYKEGLEDDVIEMLMSFTPN